MDTWAGCSSWLHFATGGSPLLAVSRAWLGRDFLGAGDGGRGTLIARWEGEFGGMGVGDRGAGSAGMEERGGRAIVSRGGGFLDFMSDSILSTIMARRTRSFSTQALQPLPCTKIL